MIDNQQASRAKKFDWKSLLKEESKQRKKLTLKLQEIEKYAEHLEATCVELEKKNDFALMRLNRAEKNYEAIARLNKQHEFKMQILDKENQRLKKIIDAKNIQIVQDEKRMHSLASSAKAFAKDLTDYRLQVKHLEEKLATLSYEHTLALQKAAGIVDEYFKHKFLDLNLNHEESILAAVTPTQQSITPQPKNQKPKVPVQAVLFNTKNSLDVDQAKSYNSPLDKEFASQIEFLESISLPSK